MTQSLDQALWFASRATGLVSLMLLTSVIVLGTGVVGRYASVRWPRFAVADLHRNLSLLVLAFLAVHICGAVIDPFAGIRWLDVVVPFGSAYRPFWLGLGAVALDLLIALALSSLARGRFSHRAWKALHWAGYALFPLVLVHGLGIGGPDSGLGWVWAWFGGCGIVVLGAVGWRVCRRHPDTLARAAAAPEGWR